MTWNTPVPPSSTPALLPARPLSLGEIVSGAWQLYRARFGLFVLLLAIPYLIMLGAFVLFGVVAAGTLVANPPTATSGPPAGFLAIAGVFYFVILALSLLVYVYQGRTTVAGIDLATGRENPTSANLAQRTPGLFGRVVILTLLGIALGIGLAVVLMLILIPIALAGSNGTRQGGGAGGGLALLLVPLIYAAAIWLSVKLFYVIPIMAEEGLGAWESIKRSFAITKGAFWKTLGHAIVQALIGIALMLVPYIILVVVAATAFSRQANEVNVGALVMVGVVFILFYAIIVLYVPYSYLFTTLMYLSRTRELAPAAAPPYGQAPDHPQYPAYPPAADQNPPATDENPRNPWERPQGGSTPQG